MFCEKMKKDFKYQFVYFFFNAKRIFLLIGAMFGVINIFLFLRASTFFNIKQTKLSMLT